MGRAKKGIRTRTPAPSDPTHGLRSKDDITYWLVLRFQQLLSDGVLKPGTRLPSERELAGKFGVARSSLRQALKVLEVMGVITQRVGDGSYLNNDAWLFYPFLWIFFSCWMTHPYRNWLRCA